MQVQAFLKESSYQEDHRFPYRKDFRQRTTVVSRERIGIFRASGAMRDLRRSIPPYVTSIRCAIPE